MINLHSSLKMKFLAQMGTQIISKLVTYQESSHKNSNPKLLGWASFLALQHTSIPEKLLKWTLWCTARIWPLGTQCPIVGSVWCDCHHTWQHQLQWHWIQHSKGKRLWRGLDVSAQAISRAFTIQNDKIGCLISIKAPKSMRSIQCLGHKPVQGVSWFFRV
jgi:hypothetical protein